MSETLTFENGAQARIYGSTAGALGYLGSASSDWDDIENDETLQKLLVRAGRYLDRLDWKDAYDTFEARDDLDLDDGSVGDAAFPFRAASYELARLAQSDESVLTVADQSSNIQSMGAGGAHVTYFSATSTSAGTATVLPPSVDFIVGEYLNSTTIDINSRLFARTYSCC